METKYGLLLHFFISHILILNVQRLKERDNKGEKASAQHCTLYSCHLDAQRE